MNFKVKEMCQLALAACLLALFSQIKIDLPGYVPLTLQTFMVYVIALTFKPNNAFAAFIPEQPSFFAYFPEN